MNSHLFGLFRRFEYELKNDSREDMKRKFKNTMEFVDDYLKDLVNQNHPFGSKEKNEFTLEVNVPFKDLLVYVMCDM